MCFFCLHTALFTSRDAGVIIYVTLILYTSSPGSQYTHVPQLILSLLFNCCFLPFSFKFYHCQLCLFVIILHLSLSLLFYDFFCTLSPSVQFVLLFSSIVLSLNFIDFYQFAPLLPIFMHRYTFAIFYIS